MSEFYWELVQFDGTTLQIPPSAVEVIKRRMANGEVINTKTMVIPANQVKSFKQTGKAFGEQPLLDAVSHAFNEPVENDDGSMVAQWVKKLVPTDRWNRYYANIPSYKHLADESGMTMIAYRVPVHLIDTATVSYCTTDDIAKLESY